MATGYLLYKTNRTHLSRQSASQASHLLQPPDTRALPVESSTHIIIGSALGGTTFIVSSLLLLLYCTVWRRRRRDARTWHHSGQCSSTPQPCANTLTLRAVSPSLRRLGTLPFQNPPSPPPAAAAPDPPVPRSSSARWDIDKGNMRTPTPHPALLWSNSDNNNNNNNKNNNNNNNNGDSGGGGVVAVVADGSDGKITADTATHRNSDRIDDSSSEPTAADPLLLLLLPTIAAAPDTMTTATSLAPLASATTSPAAPDNLRVRPSVSSTFAAELSSLLESISIKSSYSSLRCGGLGAPPPRRMSRPQYQPKQEQEQLSTEEKEKEKEEEKEEEVDVHAAGRSAAGIEQGDEEGQ